MRTAALILIMLALLCTFVVVWQTDSDSVKKAVAVDNFDKPGNKSLLEDVAYWVWPAKWQEYQDARYNAAIERIAAMNKDPQLSTIKQLEGLNQAGQEQK